jgi:hypothetical protein
MNYYTNSGSKWSDDEVLQLHKEYNVDKLNVEELCKIHKRFIGGIVSRLKVEGLIEYNDHARGYNEFIESDDYEEMKNIKKQFYDEKRKEKRPNESKEPKEKKIKTSVTESNILITIKQSDYDELKEELHDVKNQLNEIKDMIKNLAIYDFDD